MNTKKGAATGAGRRTASRARPAKTIDLKAEETKSPRAGAGTGQSAKPAGPAKAAVPETGKTARSDSAAASAKTTVSAPSATSAARSSGTGKPEAKADAKTGAGTIPSGQSSKATGSPTPIHQAETRRSGLGQLLAAAVLGGLVSLGVVGGLGSAGLLGAIPGLGSQSGDSESGLISDELAALDAQIATLRDEQALMANRLDSAATGNTETAPDAELAARVEALEVAIAENVRRVETLESAPTDSVGSARDEATSQALTTIGDRLSAAETELAALRDARQHDAGDSGLAQTISALETRFDGEITALASAIEALETSDAGSAELSGRVETLAAAVEELREARATRSQSEDRIARSVAANALRTGYERGEPFAALLASVQALTGPLEAAASLEQQAVTGVVTTQQLADTFSALAGGIIQQAQPPADGVVSQLLSNARSLVRVRPSGPMEGSSPQAIVSRIEDRLDEADLEGALTQWEALPDPAKAHSAQWAETLKERLAADRALAGILQALTPAAPATETGQSG